MEWYLVKHRDFFNFQLYINLISVNHLQFLGLHFSLLFGSYPDRVRIGAPAELRLFLVFLSRCKMLLGWYLEISHDHFIPYTVL